jgi:ABC-type sugar transport system ATPase subunit
VASIELSGICKRFGTVDVLHDLDLKIEHGEFVVVIGPSGCGKSTLLRLIAGLEEATDGRIMIDGDVVNEVPAKKRGAALVFQSYALYPHMTVAENMAFSLKLRRMSRHEIDAAVAATAKALQLDDLLERYPRELSGGQRQRVAIGRAIVRRPRVFLFDEPLSNLDAALRSQTRFEIAQLHRRIGGTSVYVTHDQVEAMTLADRIVVLNEGRIEQIGSPMEVYASPRNLFVARFIGTPRINALPGRLRSDGDSSASQLEIHDIAVDVDLHEDMATQDVIVGMRAENLSVADAADGQALHGSVRFVERLGESTLLHVELADGTVVICRHYEQENFAPDSPIALQVDWSRVLVFDTDGKLLPGKQGSIR